MTTMTISLPDELKAFIEDQAAKNGFGTASDYVQSIIRQVQERQAERDRLDSLLLEGLDSGPLTPLSPSDWDHIKQEGQKLIAERKQKRA